MITINGKKYDFETLYTGFNEEDGLWLRTCVERTITDDGDKIEKTYTSVIDIKIPYDIAMDAIKKAFEEAGLDA